MNYSTNRKICISSHQTIGKEKEMSKFFRTVILGLLIGFSQKPYAAADFRNTGAFRCRGAASSIEGKIGSSNLSGFTPIAFQVAMWNQDESWSYERRGVAIRQADGSIEYNDPANRRANDGMVVGLRIIQSQHNRAATSILTLNRPEFHNKQDFYEDCSFL
jgi:hypothetical protein